MCISKIYWFTFFFFFFCYYLKNGGRILQKGLFGFVCDKLDFKWKLKIAEVQQENVKSPH